MGISTFFSDQQYTKPLLHRKLNQITYPLYDRLLLWSIILLLVVGVVIITSASIPLGQRLQQDPFWFTKRMLVYIALAIALALGTLQIPLAVWQKLSIPMLLLIMLMSLLVLILGDPINGAVRWITLGPIHIQPSEMIKLALSCYLSDYLVRKAHGIHSSFWDFCKPLTVMLLLALLLLAQPDLGTVIVLFTTCIILLFLAGAHVWQLLGVIVSGVLALGLLIAIEPYRVRRIVAFLNPWQDPYGSGYQLIQSLMAFGRGSWYGQGLGNAIHKWEYLPAAHTDFIFAVLGEELGYVGVVSVLSIFSWIVIRAMFIGWKALQAGQNFSGYLAYAIGIWFGLQTVVNVGTSVGLLPTKGLALPLLSYGGSNLLVVIISLTILLRIDFERRLAGAQAYSRKKNGGS